MIKQKIQNSPTNINNKDDGFSHLMILLSILVVVAIGGVAYGVYVHNQNSQPVKLSATKTSQSTTKSTTLASTSPETSTLSTQATSSVKPGTISATKTSTTTTRTTSGTTTTAPASSVSPAAAATPLSVLTGIITNLDNGVSGAQVTASSITVAGPISNASARPLVFTVNGKTYIAYTQSQAPNFNQSAAQTAATMAIVPETSSVGSLEYAHLDKSNNLVDQNSAAVGYSTGGN